jgi:UDP-N-acetylmuramoyl-tripeptide--D-alanyl-D-alanine ligase
VQLAFKHVGDSTELTLSGPGRPAAAFALCRVTDGMARNAALAILAALHLGVPAKAVRERLRHWRPAKWRGEIIRQAGCILYLDFYNANPASMDDAIKAFEALAPAALRRVYLVGCMEELGPDSARYHRELGRSICLEGDGVLVVVGEQAEAVKAGALERGIRAESVIALDALDPALIRRLLQEGPCAVFVKGSRRHELERALAKIAPPEVAHA